MSRLARRGSEELSSRMQDVEPLAGMPEALRELKSMGFSLGIITRIPAPTWRLFYGNTTSRFSICMRTSSKLLGKAHEIRSVMKERKNHRG